MDLLSEHSEPFSATWPTSGTTRSGVAFELPTPALPTDATGSSSLPTPRASRGASGTETMYALGAERSDTNRPQGEVLLPTPLSTSGDTGAWLGGEGSGNLQSAVLLPTPTTQPTTGNGHARDLRSETVALLPTPAAHDSGNTPENHLRKKPGRAVVTSLQVLVDHDLIATGGRTAPPSNAGSTSQDD